eukprot:GGOE01054674.1.p1 GENE.GGOE01054674.1~~GGOE01054674.1.p1  ORF type:complete len:408 (+),score=111.59 GGOE01054674.1:226-1449(+)
MDNTALVLPCLQDSCLWDHGAHTLHTMTNPRDMVAASKKVVVKIGSALLSGPGSHDGHFLKFANEMCSLREQGREVSLVSSGAIAQGVSMLGLKKRPPGLATAQGLAAVGQPALMNTWARAFAPTAVAQFLLTKYDVSNPTSFINARRALRAVHAQGIIPIGNENDTVANDEIKIGDNDTLGAAVAKIAGADLLVILTQVDGLFTANPELDANAKLIPTVLSENLADAEAVSGGASGDGLGTGGFDTKIQAVKVAFSAGIPVVIANGAVRNVLPRVLSGEELGTVFVPPSTMRGTRWLINQWPVKGRVEVSQEAAERVRTGGEGEHFFMEDIVRVLGEFNRGDCVSIGVFHGELIGRGLVGYSETEIDHFKGWAKEKVHEKLGKRYDFQVLDRRDMVLYTDMNHPFD